MAYYYMYYLYKKLCRRTHDVTSKRARMGFFNVFFYGSLMPQCRPPDAFFSQEPGLRVYIYFLSIGVLEVVIE